MQDGRRLARSRSPRKRPAPRSGLQVRQISRTAANQFKTRGRNLLIGLREAFEVAPKRRISFGWIAPKVDELSDGSGTKCIGDGGRNFLSECSLQLRSNPGQGVIRTEVLRDVQPFRLERLEPFREAVAGAIEEVPGF